MNGSKCFALQVKQKKENDTVGKRTEPDHPGHSYEKPPKMATAI